MTLVKTARPRMRWRKWLLGAGIVLLLVLVWLYATEWFRGRREQAGLQAMSRGEYAAAAEIFDKGLAASPGDKNLAYLAAVAHRRSGDTSHFEEALRRAERAGVAPDKIALQRLLSKTQHGLGDAESDAEINRLCLRGTEDDLTAEQIYEARAKGYMSLYRVDDAYRVLSFWIEWQKQSLVPRLLRAQLFEEIDDLRHAEMDFQAIVDAHPEHLDARLQLAESQVLSRKFEQARKHYEVCAKLSPGNPRVEIGAAEIEFRSGGDMVQIEQKLTKLLRGDLDPHLQRRCWVALANIYLSNKEYGKVVSLLEAEASTGELDGPAFQALMTAYQRLNQRAKARHYRQLQSENLARRDAIYGLHQEVSKDPTNPIPRSRLGNLFWELGNKKAALTWWYTAVLAEPRHQPTHEALAKYYAAEGDTIKATQHQELAEKSVERTFALAWKDLEKGDVEALEALSRKLPYISKYPAYKPHAQLLELGLEVKKNLPLAPQDRRLTMKDLEPLVRLAQYPHLHNYALTVLGGGLYELGNMGEAEATLLDVINSDPDMIEAHRWLLSMNFDIRAFNRAQVHADVIAKLDPTDYRPHRLLGLMAKMMQSWELAIRYYGQSLQRKPTEKIKQEILLELGECQTRARQFDAALKTLEEPVESVERNVLMAECLFFTGRAAEANPILDAALAQEPGNPGANLLKADVILEQRGDLETARRHVQNILDKFPFSDSAWFKLSQIYAKQKKSKEAREANEKASELKEFQIRYSRLVEIAVSEPENIEVRQELAAIARQFGRPDLADEWDRAIELLNEKKAAVARAAAAPGANGAPAVIPLLMTPEAADVPLPPSISAQRPAKSSP